ncbi:MAG TPA: cereblon family protein [Planctomycetota bacterium]|nr:cereblon family protein [Planctomycetota bacterium]
MIAIATPESETEARTAPRRVIVCGSCGHEITAEEERISRGGSHRHTRVNPGGWVYEFGCFARAPGCRVEGESTLEHTWFAGHAWRIAGCGQCGRHLGWHFEGPEGAFFGLILERLS